ncbi:MAG TPA: hypothetical protein ENJ35_11480, partial [Gammaproteobacteria bacterium]|nr:hypothetical protein [Gammaproteobacteria bacterium]
MTSSSDLEKLQSLLLGDARTDLVQLKERIENPDTRAADIAESLPRAIQQSGKSSNLPRVLADPMTRALQVSIKQSPEKFSNVLYPVMLPAIRKSIEHALRSFMESIDLLVKQRFSLRSLKWRFESMRTGIPFTEIMLRNLLRYEAEQILLIQNGSGLLMGHVHTSNVDLKKDSDAVSAMLTAIEAFVTESFSDSKEDALDRVTIGDKIVYLEHGPHATLASVVRGVAPPEYQARLKQLNEEIHATLGKELQSFSGLKQEIPYLRDLLLQGLEREYQEAADKKTHHLNTQTKLKIITALLVPILVLGAVYYAYRRHETSRIETVINTLADSPGIVTGRVIHDDDHWTVRGLRDPDAIDPGILLRQNGLEKQVDLKLEPYLSLAPEIVRRRASRFLNIPSSLATSMKSNSLVLKGNAPLDWYLSLRANRVLPAGVRSIDETQVRFNSEDVKALLDESLQSDVTLQVIQGKHGLEARIEEAAEQLGLDPARVFKTLVVKLDDR